MTSALPIHPAILLGFILFFLSRFLVPIAHSVLLIYELARGPWDNAASSIIIATLFTVIACFIAIFLNPSFIETFSRPSDERSNLSKERIGFVSILVQSTVMTGLLIAHVMVRPRVYLITIHSLNL